MILENLAKAIGTCPRGLQLARLKLSIKYQCCGGTLQSSIKRTSGLTVNLIKFHTWKVIFKNPSYSRILIGSLAYDLLEDRHTIDIITKFFSLCV